MRRVYDPACGTGGMLIEVIEHVKAAGGSPKTLWGKLYGQEKVLTTSAIARMNLLLHGVEDFQIVREDTLRDPAFFTGDRLAQFDCVDRQSAVLPEEVGRRRSGPATSGAATPLGGVPPKGYADWAWVQHMLTSMPARDRPGRGRPAPGRAVPAGRRGPDPHRTSSNADLIEAVIGLAPNLFYGTGLAACVLILRARQARRDARARCCSSTARRCSSAAATRTPSNPSTPTSCSTLTGRSPTSTGLARVADLDEIAGNDYNLNIPLYVAPADTGEKLTLDQALADLEAAHAAGRRDPRRTGGRTGQVGPRP